jgi:hypothetical protein
MWASLPEIPTASFHKLSQAYKEILTVKPVFGSVKNRGYESADPINPRCQSDQFLQGLKYSLKVYQTSGDNPDGKREGLLHEEVGMWLLNAVPASGGGEAHDWSIAKVVVEGSGRR